MCRTVEDRFFAKVKKEPGPCWEWTGSKNSTGYGQLWVQGTMVYAHRLAYTMVAGPIPPGLFVCHKCDNRKCVNPAHLFLGTNADNMRDRDDKGRVAHGQKHYMAKLTPRKVKLIRTLYARGHGGYYNLGRMFGVSATAVRAIVKRTSWKHVA